MSRIVIIVVLFCGTVVLRCAAADSHLNARSVHANDSIKRARGVLVRWLELLSTGRYSEAVELYGDDLGILQNWNPGLSPRDHVGLLHNACKFNGLNCLPVKQIVRETALGDSGFAFTVKLGRADGSTLVIGPCCGATIAEDPPESLFVFQVRPTEGGRYVVMTLPPYSP